MRNQIIDRERSWMGNDKNSLILILIQKSEVRIEEKWEESRSLKGLILKRADV